jgi:hypothetical protein
MRFSTSRLNPIAAISLLAIAPAILIGAGHASAQADPAFQVPPAPTSISSTDPTAQAPSTTPFPGSDSTYQAPASPVSTGDPCIATAATVDAAGNPVPPTYLRRPGCVAPPASPEIPPASAVPPSDGAVVVRTSPMGFGGAYVGAGIAAGVTNGGQAGTSALFGGNIQGRIAPAFDVVPISLRAAILWGPNNTAIMPLLTYDIAVARNTNVYIGGGYSFVETARQPTPIGNKSSAVVVVGAESSVTRDIVVYGDAKLGIQPYYNTNASSLSLQAGMGYRF